jgi:hypothetical protein
MQTHCVDLERQHKEKQMGRPINKKYFGYGNTGGVGGEGFSSLVVTNTATNAGYSTTTSVTWVASSPQLTGGTAAAGTASVSFVTGQGRIQSLSVTTAGTGYTSTGSVTLTFTPAKAGTGTSVAFLLSLTNAVTNTIASSAWVPGGTQALTADIVSQQASHRYRVATSEGTGVCQLVAAAPAAGGQMTIVATDSAGNEYYVTKLTARRAVVYQKSGSGYQFFNGDSVGWNLVAAQANVSVLVATN